VIAAGASGRTLQVDAMVIGGGPAGLTAALYLARFKRSVALVDAGESRAAKIPLSHNVPGFAGGVAGSALLEAMRRHVDAYPVERIQARVTSIEPLDGAFDVVWPGGRAIARCVLLATGASDFEPSMPHLGEALREGALRYCPVCDGYEVIGQAVGVLADSAAGVEEALYLRHFTDRVSLFRASADVRFTSRDRQRLTRAGVGLSNALVTSLRLLPENRVLLQHGDQQAAICDSVYAALGMRVHSDLAAAAGARCVRDGYLVVDRHQRTTLSGLYAAGDVAAGLNQISVAVGGAAVASSAIHRALSGKSE
jgi:thioredoxin reductase (NADPH)